MTNFSRGYAVAARKARKPLRVLDTAGKQVGWVGANGDFVCRDADMPQVRRILAGSLVACNRGPERKVMLEALRTCNKH